MRHGNDGLCGPCRRELEATAEAIRRLSSLWRDGIAPVPRKMEQKTAAGLYYISGSGTMMLWSRRLSRGILRAWAEEPWMHATKGHEIPRLIAARKLLASPPKSGDELGRLWTQRYGIFSFITQSENLARKNRAERHFTTPAAANRQAGIELITCSREEYRCARRGDRKVIRVLLDRPTNYWEPPPLE